MVNWLAGILNEVATIQKKGAIMMTAPKASRES